MELKNITIVLLFLLLSMAEDSFAAEDNESIGREWYVSCRIMSEVKSRLKADILDLLNETTIFLLHVASKRWQHATKKQKMMKRENSVKKIEERLMYCFDYNYKPKS